jgi:hypothetical protein
LPDCKDIVPMQLFLKSTKLLNSSSSKDVLNNNVLHKDAATPCDGLSDSMHLTFIESKTGLAPPNPYCVNMLDDRNFQENTILDSIQNSLSLEMQNMSEHTKNTNSKRVKTSIAMR